MKDEQEKKSGAWWQDGVAQREPMKPIAGTVEDAMKRLSDIAEKAKAFRRSWEIWAAVYPQTKACERHPNRILKVWPEMSADQSFRQSQEGEEKFVLIYEPCPECVIEQKIASESHWLTRCGVPEILIHGSFKTFRTENDQDRDNLTKARAFAAKKKGFLVLSGSVGDGKSLLAVAILREFLGGKFITQNNLLIDLRRGYRDPKAEDVIRRCQQAKCLVIDDFGLSMGGADELPMLQSILDHRYGEKLPVIVTSNLTLPQIYDLMGPRLTDRFKQALYACLIFSGPSSRSAERQNYLSD